MKTVVAVLVGILTGVGSLVRAALPAPDQSGIQHIVVVMMENRSFDHFVGWAPGANGRQAGLSFTDTNGVAHATYPLAPDFQGCGHPDPDHDYAGGRIELNGGACDGWLRAGQNDIFSIGYYQQADLPFLGVAATNWTLCDNYFAAILAGTYPNRVYSHAAQTDRLDNTLKISDLPTIWDRLSDKDLKARYYFSDIPMLALWGVKYVPIMRFVSSFFDDAAAGNLPDVCWVEPRFIGETQGISGDDHPVSDIRAGEAFLSKVYNAVINSPNWTNTVLVINFDEWGGFFDHVAPTAAPVPEADKAAGDSSGLRGFRVPALLISPWSPRGTVAHDIYDHTSVLKMIEWRYGLNPLTIRDQTARNLAEALDFAHYNTNAPAITAPDFVSEPCAIKQPFFTLSGTNLVVNWTSDAKLQVATDIAGPWTETTNTVNGFSFTPSQTSQFFRIYNGFDSLLEMAKSMGIPMP
jgi:phospholipase C